MCWVLKLQPGAPVAAVRRAFEGSSIHVSTAQDSVLLLDCPSQNKEFSRVPTSAELVVGSRHTIDRAQVTQELADAESATESAEGGGGRGVTSSRGVGDSWMGRPLVPGEPLLEGLQRCGLVDALFPAHDPSALRQLRSKALSGLLLPVTAFRSYFGDAAGFYCAFANGALLWLLAPAVVAAYRAATAFLTSKAGGPVAPEPWEDPLVPILSSFCVVWGGLGLKLWVRQEAWLALRWGISPAAAAEPGEEVAPSFRGYQRRSPVTGSSELHYPALRRAARVAAGAAATLALLAAAAALLVAVLNLQGAIEERHAWLYIRRLAALREPGGLLSYHQLLPTACRVAASWAFTNLVYTPVAKRLTLFENQRTVAEVAASLQVKRYALQALFDFAPLLYMSLFTAGGLPAASRDLRGFYQVEAARQAAFELLLPPLLQRLQAGARRRRGPGRGQRPGVGAGGVPLREQGTTSAAACGGGAFGGSGPDDNGREPARAAPAPAGARAFAPHHEELQGRDAPGGGGAAKGWRDTWPPPGPGLDGTPLASADLPPPRRALLRRAAEDALRPGPPPSAGAGGAGAADQFEAVSSLVRDLGYAVVFAPALPSGPLICLCLVALMLRLEAMKMLGGRRRPVPGGAAGIGRAWRGVIAAQLLVAVLSNSLIAGLGSRQLQRLLPASLQEAAEQVAISATSPDKMFEVPDAVTATRPPLLPTPAASASAAGGGGTAATLGTAAAAAAVAGAAGQADAPAGGGGGPAAGGDAVVAVARTPAGAVLLLARPGPLLLAVLLEHALLLALLLIHVVIPDEPEAVRTAAQQASRQLHAPQGGRGSRSSSGAGRCGGAGRKGPLGAAAAAAFAGDGASLLAQQVPAAPGPREAAGGQAGGAYEDDIDRGGRTGGARQQEQQQHALRRRRGPSVGGWLF